jgi:purine-binding chemotaxis protein CheW
MELQNSAATDIQTDANVAAAQAEELMPHKYLVWLVADQRYAVLLSEVREVISMPKITDLPVHHHTLRGVFNLRGKIISVADLREKLSCVKNHKSKRPFILAVDIDGQEIGTIVDDVAEVTEFFLRDIQRDVENRTHLNTKRDYVSGIVVRAEPQNDTTLILDMKKLVEP